MLTYSYTYTFNVIQIILCSFSFIFLVNLKKYGKSPIKLFLPLLRVYLKVFPGIKILQ